MLYAVDVVVNLVTVVVCLAISVYSNSSDNDVIILMP